MAITDYIRSKDITRFEREIAASKAQVESARRCLDSLAASGHGFALRGAVRRLTEAHRSLAGAERSLAGIRARCMEAEGRVVLA